MRFSEDGYRKIDTVRDARVLADAAQLAELTGLPLQTVAGRPALKIDGNTPLCFVPPRKDLRAYDQLVAVYRTGGAPVRPHLAVELTTRTEGLTSCDSFSSGPGAVTVCEDAWCEYPFPWENFLVFGMGQLVYPVRQLRLRFDGATPDTPVWLAELRVERRDRAAGPRLTDAGLRAALDGFDGPSMLAHLRHREHPRHRYTAPQAPVSADLLETAEAICRNVINGYDLGDPIDWHVNPNGYLEWMHALNRHGWIRILLTAYQKTGDPRYVRKLDALWESWLRDNPEPEGHNGGGDPAWETLSTAVRINGTWLQTFFVLLDDPAFRDSTRIEILKSFYGHAEHLMAHQGHANNWLIVESRVLFVLGLLFPEFKRAEAWFTEGVTRLERELATQIWPDGADWEIAPGYHIMACQGFLEPLELARLNGISLPPLFEERLPATFEYIAGMTRPDGTLPSVNDSGGWRNRQSAVPHLEQGARLFGRPDFRQSPEGPYAGRSRVFPDAGFHILASGTGREALWSMLDGGPPGASHCHEDALNVEFFAMGLPFIVDPGITGYMQDDWTAYYRRTDAHNTVLVNGASQAWSVQPHAERAVSMRGRGCSALGDIADLARATYDRLYHGQPAGLTHTRALLFVRGRYWVVFDEVRGDAASMEARFQFVPLRLTLDKRRRVFRTLRQNLPNLELRPLAVAGRLSLTAATGDTAPVGGWVSDGEDVPAPQARIKLKRREQDSCLRLATVVYPYARGVGSGLQITVPPPPAADTAHTDITLRHADGTRDRLRYAWGDDDGQTAVPSDAVLLRLDLNGRTRRLQPDGRWVD